MGQGGSRPQAADAHAVNRCSFTDGEYESLRKSLDVADDVPEARVELASFVACFPAHLRPLVQPLFFQLGQEQVGNGSAAWPQLVQGLSRLMKDGGIRWRKLLEAWTESSASPAQAQEVPVLWAEGSTTTERDEGQPTEQELDLYLELATTLCFWCACADRSPTAPEEASEKSEPTDVERVVAALSAGVAAASQGGRSLTSMATWLESSMPMLPAAVGQRLAGVLLGSAAPTLVPALESRILDAGLLLMLRGLDARLWESSSWVPLYRDWRDGRSFNALVKGCLHYEGPGLLVLQTAEGQVLGALSTSWQDGNGKFGGSTESFLFALLPALTLCRSSSRSGNYVYFNSRNKYAPRGLGFGGQVGFCRLWLDADFEECHVLQSDATYGPGMLLPGGTGLQRRFDVVGVEVWGCGGTDALQAQAARQERAENAREQARKVDRAKLCENDFDKEMFFGNTFSATAGSREPVDPKEKTSKDS